MLHDHDQLNIDQAGDARLERTRDVLRKALTDKAHGEVAVVSSFGAESAVLLHLVAEANPATPVIFLDTRMHFEETLRYRDELASRFGLTELRLISPSGDAIREKDPYGRLHLTNADACCAFRKTQVLSEALKEFDGWVSGRKRFQAVTREEVNIFERAADGKLKINPLAHWTKSDIDAHFTAFDLPQHPLVAHGYPSIGCAACTSRVEEGEDARAGRWRGSDKTECGIHFENGKLVRTANAGAGD
ncbi:phosphoadenylyl-sulfate reductase [Oricola sp.]|uniref:phosphoadenylyl-sulfate reductase n=1 Tax=Oricola sp. TaxID=1979950 RepID=UPI0025E0530E|nr:phosphoadenylyl-sulfate reductase [Oricola sp.]MCI5075617.1 phosphoadenylyl-sulfate reductase [Oricola sp.]